MAKYPVISLWLCPSLLLSGIKLNLKSAPIVWNGVVLGPANLTRKLTENKLVGRCSLRVAASEPDPIENEIFELSPARLNLQLCHC
jgi:hypothetical protein